MKKTLLCGMLMGIMAAAPSMASRRMIYDSRPSGSRITASRDFDIGNPYPALMDSDGDGLTDLTEYFIGTDPNRPDSDGNGLNDGMEIIGLLR